MLNRIKAIKDLFLQKLDEILRRLDRLEEVSKTTQDLAIMAQRLDTLAEAQLENETALLEASIRSLQLLEGMLEGNKSKAFLLLGNAPETKAVAQALGLAAPQITMLDWDWGNDINLSHVSEQTQIILCKLPTESHHWESLQKLQQQVSRPIGIFTLL